MNLFFHDVGFKGSESDFPKTIYNSISIEELKNNKFISRDSYDELKNIFPSGYCNFWGVPEGAKSIIKTLSVGDYVLLVRTTGGQGDVPILCMVKFFFRESMPEASKFLWGSSRFPFIFLFDTEIISYSWSELKLDFNYNEKFRPSGNIYRVKSERLDSFSGIEGYISKLRGGSKEVTPPKEPLSFNEGERLRRETNYFNRNGRLAEIAKLKHGFTCCLCGFNFEKIYGDLGREYIECHHLNPLSEKDSEGVITTLNDVSVLCANCHRMVHRRRPAYTLDEVRLFMTSNTEVMK